MRDINAALYQFWSGFGIPAYRAGRVPDNAALPYITFEVETGDALTSTVLVAHTWHQAPGATAAAADVLDSIARAIPHTGAILPVGDRGHMVLYRNGSGWQSYVEDPEDSSVVGGKTRYIVRFHLL